MARKKVTLAWIANDASRRATFKKRRRGLLKKVSELTTLCDIPACVVVYGPGEHQPEAWPSAPEAMALLARFRSLPDMEQTKKMTNQEGFIRANIAKLQEQHRKLETDNRELMTNHLVHECLAGIHPEGLRSIANMLEGATLIWVLEMKMRSVQDKMTSMSLNAAAPAVSVGDGGASGSQALNYNVAVQLPLDNPFPLLNPPPSAPVAAAAFCSSSSAPAPQNLLTTGGTTVGLGAVEPAVNQRPSYFADFGAANKSNDGTLSSVVESSTSSAKNVIRGSSSGAGDYPEEDEILPPPPGLEDQQAMNLSCWFDGSYCLNPNFKPDYTP